LAEQAVKFSNFAYLFQRFFSKEHLLSRYACWTIIFCSCLASNSEKYKTGLQ